MSSDAKYATSSTGTGDRNAHSRGDSCVKVQGTRREKEKKEASEEARKENTIDIQVKRMNFCYFYNTLSFPPLTLPRWFFHRSPFYSPLCLLPLPSLLLLLLLLLLLFFPHPLCGLSLPDHSIYAQVTTLRSLITKSTGEASWVKKKNNLARLAWTETTIAKVERKHLLNNLQRNSFHHSSITVERREENRVNKKIPSGHLWDRMASVYLCLRFIFHTRFSSSFLRVNHWTQCFWLPKCLMRNFTLHSSFVSVAPARWDNFTWANEPEAGERV